MKQIYSIVIYSIFLSLISGCERVEDLPANLAITNIDFTETYSNTILDLPNGSYVPDNPNFDINKPETWTGNMAKFINHNYLYSVSYNVKNSGSSTAYDTEIDLHYIYDNGDESVETIHIGDIEPSETWSSSSGTGCTNKQLIRCDGEVFWTD